MVGVASSQAASHRWHLEDVVFDNGNSAKGYFVYDDESGTVTDWMITLEGGHDGFPQVVYTPTNSHISFATNQYIRFTHTDRGRILQIATAKPLRTELEAVALSNQSAEVLFEARPFVVKGLLKGRDRP